MNAFLSSVKSKASQKDIKLPIESTRCLIIGEFPTGNLKFFETRQTLYFNIYLRTVTTSSFEDLF